MTFYAAAGSYQIREENGKKMPYIMRLGKLQPVSIPEFCIWSMLLWDVMTYDELSRKCAQRLEAEGIAQDMLTSFVSIQLQNRKI